MAKSKNERYSHPDFLPNDIVVINDDGEVRELMTIRQFGYQRLIVKIRSEVGLISDIRIVYVEQYPESLHCNGAGFWFSTTSDLIRFAKRVDTQLGEVLRPLEAQGDEVSDIALARAILRRFESPDMFVSGKIEGWKYDSQYLHQSGVKFGYYDVVNVRIKDYNPQEGADVKVKVATSEGQLIAVHVIDDQLSTDGMKRIQSEIHVVDPYATMLLQDVLGVKGIDVYKALVEKYAPFSLDRIQAFRALLDGNHIEYVFETEESHVPPKTIWYRIDLGMEKGRGDLGDGNVEYGSCHYLDGEISYINTTIVGVKVEDVETSSGCWHDNPNYQYSNVQRRHAQVTGTDQIQRFSQALGIDAPTPEGLREVMKPKFSSFTEFIDFLKKHDIKYQT